ncbi:ImmA/IrrE family metallo-endopeptidase [Lacticaseibacillus paracasei]|uniref:ImmA/IrrE family metallo-endopeptidase n=1 Tax=Lacticaseibacillus paracasei TaxID=1597 RepID=UPI002F266ED3
MGYSESEALAAADHMSNRYGTSDPFKLAKRDGISIRRSDLGNNILGYSMQISRMPLIVLSWSLNDCQATAVCAHELGHCKMHRELDTNFFSRVGAEPMVGDNEYQANCFMFELVFGDQEVSPMNYNAVLDQYELPHWMWRYFEVIH